MGNLALDAPRLEIIQFIKRSNKEMTGFRGVAQIGKSSPGGTRLEISKFLQRSKKEMTGFRGASQIENSSPGRAKAGN